MIDFPPGVTFPVRVLMGASRGNGSVVHPGLRFIGTLFGIRSTTSSVPRRRNITFYLLCDLVTSIRLDL